MSATKTLYLDGVNASYANTRRLAESSTGLTTAAPSNTFNAVPTANLNTDPWPSRGGGTGLATQNASSPTPDGTGFELDGNSMDGLHLESGSALSLQVGTVTSNAFQGYLRAELWLRRGTSYLQRVGTLVSSLTSFNGTDNPTLTGTQTLSQQFLSGDRLYLQFYLQITTTETNTTTFTINEGTTNGLTITTITHAEYQAAYAPANDDFANAIAVTGYSGTQSRSNYRASYEAGEPIPSIGNTEFGNIDGTGSVWYKWTAPADGSVHTFYADTITSSSNSRIYSNLIINTRLAVYTGTAVNALTQVAYNDNQQSYSDNGAYTPNSNMSPKKCSKVSFQATPGVTYYFQICTQSYNYTGGSPTDDTWSGTIPFHWVAAGYGAWQTAAPITDIHRSQETGSDKPWDPTWHSYWEGATNNDIGHYASRARVWAGGWEMWQSFGSPDPHDQLGAYECCSAHARHGDQSDGQYGSSSPNQGGWTSVGYEWVSPGEAGAYCAPLWYVRDWAAQGFPGTYPNGSGLRTGGNCSVGLPSFMIPGDMNVRIGWSFLQLEPAVVAHETQYWQYQGSLPPGAVGVIYEKECCDIISMRVRPAAVGNSYHPSNDPGPDVGVWMQVPVISGTTPGYGFFELQQETNLTGANHRYINGNPSQMLGMALGVVGTSSWLNGVQTRTTEWYDCNALETVRPFEGAYDQNGFFYPDRGGAGQKRYWFVLMADWIMAEQNIGYQAGNPTWSFTRRMDNQDLEIELVLQPPRYAFLYAAPGVPDETPDLGVAADRQHVHFQPPHPTGHADVVVSQHP